MSQIINLWQLNDTEQDKLWINSVCPKCGAKIIQKEITVDYANFVCSRCDISYVCE